MIIPKLFRFLFFRKSVLNNVFDAVRDKEAKYIDASINLGSPIETIENSFHLNNKSLKEFIIQTPKDATLIIFGNHKGTRMRLFQELKESGYNHIFEVGTIQDLRNVQDSI